MVKVCKISMLALAMLAACAPSKPSDVIDLSGEWTVTLDPQIVGDDNVAAMQLPGTTDLAGLGVPNDLAPALEKPQVLRLTRKHSYVGKASYTRTIDVPEHMADRKLRLELERVLWKSQVVVDGDTLPTYQESLTTPHVYELPQGLSAGKHEITLVIDNTKQHDVSVDNLCHSYTNDTQVMWNGVLGSMTLAAVPDVEVADVQAYTQLASRTIDVRSVIDNATSQACTATVAYLIDGKQVHTAQADIKPGANVVSSTFALPESVKEWSEFSPNVYSLTVECQAGESASAATVPLGLREIAADGTTLKVNGKPAFLRGTLECCIFPLTGTPPTDTQSWAKVMGTAKEWGLNHLRFHSWCPPDAAFRAADSLGMYLQVELPQWTLTVNSTPDDSAFIYDEFDRISRNYGNHPSLALMTCGNELQPDFGFLNRLTAHMKATDPRQLYSCTSFTFERGHGGHAEPEDQFLITQWTDHGWVRGQGVFDQVPPSFNKNYASAMTELTVPLITHEIGQYAVYPRLAEIDKYTGTLDPLNFKAVRADMESKGLNDNADRWTEASARLAFLLYKEEIERAMKTPGLSGFQLLGLQDFPGQGTALVGLVDAFWDSKGVVDADEFAQFCAPVVPLAMFDKAVYTAGDTFEAPIMVANYGASDLAGESITCRLLDADGNVLYSSTTQGVDLGMGMNETSAKASTVLQADKAAQYTLEATVDGVGARNTWHIWVFPKLAAADIKALAEGITLTTDLAQAQAALAQGGKVLFSPATSQIVGLEGKFVPVFWSPVHFPNQAGTMGMLVDPSHPALAQFPTDMHTDWQWWSLLKHSATMVTDSLDVTPIVSQVDSFTRNRRLASMFEAKVGDGTLVMSGIDLLGASAIASEPERMQLLASVLAYMQSADFAPKGAITEEQLAALIDAGGADKASSPESIYQ